MLPNNRNQNMIQSVYYKQVFVHDVYSFIIIFIILKLWLAMLNNKLLLTCILTNLIFGDITPLFYLFFFISFLCFFPDFEIFFQIGFGSPKGYIWWLKKLMHFLNFLSLIRVNDEENLTAPLNVSECFRRCALN